MIELALKLSLYYLDFYNVYYILLIRVGFEMGFFRDPKSRILIPKILSLYGFLVIGIFWVFPENPWDFWQIPGIRDFLSLGIFIPSFQDFYSRDLCEILGIRDFFEFANKRDQIKLKLSITERQISSLKFGAKLRLSEKFTMQAAIRIFSGMAGSLHNNA